MYLRSSILKFICQKITENTRNRDVNIFEKAPVSTPLSIDGGDSHLLGKEGPSLSPPSSEMVEVFPGCVLSVLATCSVFIPLFISGLAGLYANRGQKGYWEEKESMPGKHLMSSGLIIFHEISDQEKDQGWYCGIPEPLISKESPYYTPHMEGRIKRNKKTFCYQFLFPVFPLKREEFLLNCIKSDSDLKKKGKFEKEIILRELYNDFIFYNKGILVVLTFLSQISFFFIIRPYIRVKAL